jgi:hypothetical protein
MAKKFRDADKELEIRIATAGVAWPGTALDRAAGERPQQHAQPAGQADRGKDVGRIMCRSRMKILPELECPRIAWRGGCGLVGGVDDGK